MTIHTPTFQNPLSNKTGSPPALLPRTNTTSFPHNFSINLSGDFQSEASQTAPTRISTQNKIPIGIPTYATATKQQSISSYFAVNKTSKLIPVQPIPSSSKWVQQKLVWGPRSRTLEPSTGPKFHVPPTVENTDRPPQLVTGNNEDQQGSQSPSLLRIGEEPGLLGCGQTQTPPCSPNSPLPVGIVSTSAHEQHPLRQSLTVRQPPVDTIHHKSHQTAVPNQGIPEQHILDSSVTTTTKYQPCPEQNMQYPLTSPEKNDIILDYYGYTTNSVSNTPTPAEGFSNATDTHSDHPQTKRETKSIRP
jgi:hypothetical protein